MNEWKRKAGRTLLVGLPGATIDPEIGDALRRIGPAGVILFARNMETPAQTAELLAAVLDSSALPALLAVDQEGGRVSRLEPWIGKTPPAARFARAGTETARRFGNATGRALRSLGFNVDFAPVVDLCDTAATNGIGDRSFGTDPELVCELAGAFCDGLQSTGVAGCLKHFPGLGSTSVDSHDSLPVARRPRERMECEDLVPFARLGPRSAAVMVGHGSYPELGSAPGLPASLSRTVVHRWLRERLGYRGLVVTDDLQMGAVAPLDRDGTAAVAAMRAGCDLLLYCSDLELAERAAEALASEASADPLMARRLDEAVRAIDEFAARWPARDAGAPDWETARAELRDAIASA